MALIDIYFKSLVIDLGYKLHEDDTNNFFTLVQYPNKHIVHINHYISSYQPREWKVFQHIQNNYHRYPVNELTIRCEHLVKLINGKKTVSFKSIREACGNSLYISNRQKFQTLLIKPEKAALQSSTGEKRLNHKWTYLVPELILFVESLDQALWLLT